MTVSLTVKTPKRASSCSTKENNSRVENSVELLIVTRPWLRPDGVRWQMASRNVDLPAPEGPMTVAEEQTGQLKSSQAATPPRRPTCQELPCTSLPIERSQQRTRSFRCGDGQARPSEDERVLRPGRGAAFEVFSEHCEGTSVVGGEREAGIQSRRGIFSAFREPSSVTGGGNRPDRD